MTLLSLASCASAATAPVAESSPTKVAAASASPETHQPSPATGEAATGTFETCGEIITPEFGAMVASNGWIGWNMVGEAIGHSPFDDFPGGAPAGQLSCRFGAGPEVATDNVLDLAWAPLSADAAQAAQAAQDALAAQGYERIDVADGVQWALRSDHNEWADEDGWGPTYLFTDTDVRWAAIRDELPYIAPAA